MQTKSRLFTVVLIGVSLAALLAYWYGSKRIEPPDGFTAEGYCVVYTLDQMAMGLNRFETEEEFMKSCKGKMLFVFDRYLCTTFISDEMAFPVILNDLNTTHLLDVNSTKKVCGSLIIEEI